ncbi:lysophospholipid acyltransferase family protein [Litorimonas sp. RW-G-Af-16]
MMMASLRRYTIVMTWAMRNIAGIKVEVLGRENVPDDQAVILAAKHQSYGDGFVIFSQFFDMSFVTGNQLLKIPLLPRILDKMDAVVIDSCGGSDVRQEMEAQAAVIREQGRKILIFPEGHLSQIGTQHRYRKGVWHLYNDFGCPVVPVANSLGQRWNQMDWKKYQGPAFIEFLDPIPPGMEKEPFMALLEERIETRSKALLDRVNLGALNPDDIGKTVENDAARAKRLARESEAATVDPTK